MKTFGLIPVFTAVNNTSGPRVHSKKVKDASQITCMVDYSDS